MPKFIRTAPAVLRNPLKAGYLFKGYVFNYMGFALTSLQSGRINPTQFAALVTPMLMLAGVNGLPFADDLKQFFRSMGWFDTDDQVRKMFGEHQKLADMALKGIPTQLPSHWQFDISKGRFGLGNVLPEGSPSVIAGIFTANPELMNLGRPLVDIFMGAPWSMSERAMDGLADFAKGEYTLGWRKMSPVAANNLIKAFTNRMPSSGGSRTFSTSATRHSE